MLTNIKEIKENALKITDKMLSACSNPDRWNFELADLEPEPDNHVEIAMYYDAATDTVNYSRALYFGDTWTVPDLDKYQLFNFIEIPNGPITEKDLKFELTSAVQENRNKINEFTSQTIDKKMQRNLPALGFSLLILILIVLGSNKLLDKCVPIKKNYPQAIASYTKQVNHVYNQMLVITTDSGKNKYLYLTDDDSKMQSVKKKLLTNNKSVSLNSTKDNMLVTLNYGFSGRLKSYSVVKSPIRLTGDDSNNVKAVKVKDSKALESNIVLKEN